MKKHLFIFAVLFFAPSANAEILREQFEGIRPTGMGNAFLALADDANALFYNPAGLAFVKGAHINLIDMAMGAESWRTFSSFFEALKTGNYNGLIRTTDSQYLRVMIKPTFVFPYFGFSLYENMNAFFDFRQLTAGNIDVWGVNDLGGIFGVGMPVSKYASVGFSLRVFHRSAIDAHMTQQDFLNELGISQTDFEQAAYTAMSRRTGQGWALGLNLGSMLKIPLAGKSAPTVQLAATLDDFSGTKFREIGTTSVPATIGMKANLGAALIYDLNKKTKFNMTLDCRDFTHPLPFFKQMHFGAELRHSYFGFRTGLYQGYPTGGFSLEFPPHTRLHLTTYAVELGKTFWSRSQRWYLAQLVIGFNPF